MFNFNLDELYNKMLYYDKVCKANNLDILVSSNITCEMIMIVINLIVFNRIKVVGCLWTSSTTYVDVTA